MKKVFLYFFLCFILNPIYGQIDFAERVNIYDTDSLGVNVIYDDFDNDSDIDIIKYGLPNSYRNVLLQKNDNGDFNSKLPKFIDNNINPIISLDINNDDYPDILTFHSFNTIGVLYNMQNDSFSEEETISNFLSNSYTIYPVKLDYNNDGYIDLVISNSNNDIYLLPNNQNGGFSPAQLIISLNSNIDGIYKFEDFDNDGDFDIYGFQNNYLKIFLNNNGSFVQSNILQTQYSQFESYGIFDIDGNGFKDILYWKNGAIWAKYFGFNSNTNQYIVLNDLLVIQNIPFYSNTYSDHKIYVNNQINGAYDVYIASENTQHHYNINKFSVENGVFSNSQTVLSNFEINMFSLNNFKFIDIDNNGDIDFSFTSSFNQQNMIFINYNIDELSENRVCIQQAINTHQFNIVDMNGDGVEDICVGSQNGLGYFEKMINNEYSNIKNLIGVMSNPNASTYTLNNIMDFDNDGMGDVIDYSESGMYAKVFKNLGNDNFLYVQNVSIPILTTGIFFEDIDNDGFIDMLFKKNFYSSGDELMWSKNNNGLHFENVLPLNVNYNNQINTISLAFEDINNNGNTDIILLSTYYENNTFNYEVILLENQNGIFLGTSIVSLSDDYSSGSIKIKDIDQDGDLDFFVYDINVKPFLFYRNDGQNNFYKIIIDNINIHDIEFDDNDGDGNYEIYAMNYNPTLYLSNIFYYNTFDFLNFTKFEIDSYGTTYDSRADLLLFDYNSDNKKDLFINNPNMFNGLISVYINSSNTLSIEETSNNTNNLKIFPNPFTNYINWNGGTNKNYKLKLFTLEGILMYENKTSNNSLDISFLDMGTYVFVIEDENLYQKKVYKIIKK